MNRCAAALVVAVAASCTADAPEAEIAPIVTSDAPPAETSIDIFIDASDDSPLDTSVDTSVDTLLDTSIDTSIDTPLGASDTSPTPDAALRSALDAVLAEWYGAPGVGGAVAAVRTSDGTVEGVAIGVGAPGVPASTDDTMRIGSITKTFMAALVLRLGERRVLDLDDPVVQHLPELSIHPSATVRDLLAHTSGVRDPDPAHVIGLILDDPGRRFEYDELVDLADLPTVGEARPGFAYSNSGYHLLGGVIEAVAGTGVATVLRSEVLEPAGLKGTYLAGAEDVPAPIVPGNVDLDGDGRPDSLVDVPYVAVETGAWTAGALVTTPSDLLSFMRALFDGTLLEEGSLAAMIETNGSPQLSGLGIFELGIDGILAYGNSGAMPGYHAVAAHDPERDVTAALFTNCPWCVAGAVDSSDVVAELLAIASRR